MQALIVYESLWGSTAAVAHAIAEGLGEGARVASTAEAAAGAVAEADLIVAGGPVFVFHLSSDRVREDIRARPEPGAPTPDLDHPSMRSWLDALPPGSAYCAAFDTHVRGPFGRGAPAIARALQDKGYRLLESEGFVVHGKYGPMSAAELARARAWGAHLRALVS